MTKSLRLKNMTGAFLGVYQEDNIMSNKLDIRIDDELKERAEDVLDELGYTLTTAVDLFLRAVVRDRRLPFEVQWDHPNATTIAAIEEGRRLARDPSAPSYSTMEELKAALEE